MENDNKTDNVVYGSWTKFNLDKNNDNYTITAKKLWEMACDYFKWCDEHPIVEYDTVRVGKDAGTQIETEKRRPYEVSALCLHCCISDEYLRELLDMPGNTDYKRVAQAIKYTIKSQLIEYGLINIFNTSLVTKILGIGIEDETDNMSGKSIKVELIKDGIPELSNSENDFSEFDLIQDEISKVATEHSPENRIAIKNI